jgi:hypothetical protein
MGLPGTTVGQRKTSRHRKTPRWPSTQSSWHREETPCSAGRAIKVTTINNYLWDVAQFLIWFLVDDICKVDATQLRLAPVIQYVEKAWHTVGIHAQHEESQPVFYYPYVAYS